MIYLIVPHPQFFGAQQGTIPFISPSPYGAVRLENVALKKQVDELTYTNGLLRNTIAEKLVMIESLEEQNRIFRNELQQLRMCIEDHICTSKESWRAKYSKNREKYIFCYSGIEWDGRMELLIFYYDFEDGVRK